MFSFRGLNVVYLQIVVFYVKNANCYNLEKKQKIIEKNLKKLKKKYI